MTEGFRPPPPPDQPTTTPDWPRYQQEITDTAHRAMAYDTVPPLGSVPPLDPPAPPSRHPTDSPAAGDSSTTDTAKDQAAQVAHTAKQAGTQVADTVKEQAGQVTAEAGKQAKQLLSQAQSEATEQAAATQSRVAEGLHALADELTGMANNSEQDGPATDLARQAADKAHQAAGWLADRDPGALLDEVRSFARRKPGAYLAIALGAGVLAGRLTRGLTASTDDTPTSSTGLPSGAAGQEAGLLSSGPTQFARTEPVHSSLLADPPALGAGAVLPQTPAPMGGLGAGGAWGDPQGEVTR